MDAIAVTLASGGRYIGVAPLGTSLTDEQASQLAAIGKNPIVATDADIAGRVAAERDFWILAPYRLDSRFAPLPEGSDPADLLALNGPAALTIVLDQAGPLGDELINERLTSLPPAQAQLEAARVVAARPPGCWDEGSNTISSRLNLPLPAVRRTLLAHATEWNIDPRRAAANPLPASTRSRSGWPGRLRSGRSSGGRRWLASSTSDSSDRQTGRRWRSSCRASMIKDTMSPHSHEP
jgi:DNA primase